MSTTFDATATLADEAVLADIAAVRERGPLVHYYTNGVAINISANALLAIGASPAAVQAREQVEQFAAIADGLLINVGTVDSHSAEAMLAAAASAHAAGTPWVLDPVAVGALPYYLEVSLKLLEHRPTVIRGNASEILGLSGATGGRGVDTTATSADALPAARELATRTGAVIAISGEVDYVTDGERVVAVPGGDERITRVTAVGCTLGAVIAAYLAVSPTPLQGAVTGSVAVGIAGERAAAESRGTGSLAVALIDHLSLL